MTKDAQWLLEEKYGGKESAAYEEDKKRLAAGEPLAYVIGSQPFLGLKIFLDSRPLIPPYSANATQGTRPLIPRPETEWWTEQLLANVGTSYVPTLKFLDLCAGSGAIGCAALKYLPNAHVYFGEVDPAHEATILKNIRENGLDESPYFAPPSPKATGGHSRATKGTRADVRIGDLFEPFGDMTFDVIAANPPYVPAGRALPPSVARHEPMLALLAGEDGLNCIRRIASELPRRLAAGGVAWVECDRSHAETARSLFTAQGFSALIRTDQYGKPRVIVVSFLS